MLICEFSKIDIIRNFILYPVSLYTYPLPPQPSHHLPPPLTPAAPPKGGEGHGERKGGRETREGWRAKTVRIGRERKGHGEQGRGRVGGGQGEG